MTTEVSEQFGGWMRAQAALCSLSVEEFAEVQAEAECLVEMMGRDPKTREKIYRAMNADEQKCIRVAFGTFRNGALVLNEFNQTKEEWTSVLMGAFAIRKVRDARR